MIKKFRKRPVEIEAIQWTGENQLQVSIFMAESKEIGWRPSRAYGPYDTIVIHTLEGNMEASIGDWIIRGVKGEFYPCKPDIFQITYEEVPIFGSSCTHFCCGNDDPCDMRELKMKEILPQEFIRDEEKETICPCDSFVRRVK